MKLVKPAIAPQNSPGATVARVGAPEARRSRNSMKTTKPTEISPTASLTACSSTRAAISQPAPTPIAPAGARIARLRGSQSRRNAQTLTQSWTIRIGRMIAAALTGEIASANSGMASVLRPEKPPFDRPSSTTAGIAAK